MYLCLSIGFDLGHISLNTLVGVSVCWSINLINTGKNRFFGIYFFGLETGFNILIMFISLSLSVGRSVEQVLCVLKPLTSMFVTDVPRAFSAVRLSVSL